MLATFPSGPMPVALWEKRIGEGAAKRGGRWFDHERPPPDAGDQRAAARARAPGAAARSPARPRGARPRAPARCVRARWRTPAPGDTPVDRLRAAGATAERVAENLARARSLAVAHARIARFAAHRANLLDAAVDAVGVGVAHAGAWLYVVELLATRG